MGVPINLAGDKCSLNHYAVLWKVNFGLSHRSNRGRYYSPFLSLGASTVLTLFVLYALSTLKGGNSGQHSVNSGPLFILLYLLVDMFCISYRIGSGTALLPRHLCLFQVYQNRFFGTYLCSSIFDIRIVIFWMPCIPLILNAFRISAGIGFGVSLHLLTLYLFLQISIHVCFLLTLPFAGKHQGNIQVIPSLCFLGLLTLLHLGKLDALLKYCPITSFGTPLFSPERDQVFTMIIQDGFLICLSVPLCMLGNRLVRWVSSHG